MTRRAALLTMGLAFPALAWGHAVDLSSLEITAERGHVEEVLDMSLPTLSLLADVDLDRDGIVTPQELSQRTEAVFAATLGASPLTAGGALCELRPAGVRLAANRVLVGAKGDCAPGELRQVLAFLRALPPGQRVVGRAQVDGEHHEFVAEASSATEVLGAGPERSLARFIGLGVEHIWTGYDHLMFLLGLLLLGGSLKRLFAIVSSFTVAHSITLALAALGIVGLPTRLVESAIAASIAYVAAEDFLVNEARMRWVVAFAFGLVHGFGFASALSELRLSGSDLARALFGFNLGVEVGQAVVVGFAWPILLFLRRNAKFREWGVKALALLVFGFGIFWFAERAFDL